jgi:tetratricopeptide (TPR) repeat protein
MSTVLNTTAVELGHVGRTPEAIGLFRRSLEASLDPQDSTQVLINLAEAYIELGDFAEAKRIVDQAKWQARGIGDLESIWNTRLLQATLLSLEGDTEKADTIYNDVIAEYPEDEPHRVLRLTWGDHKMRSGQLDPTTDMLETAVKVYGFLDRRSDQAEALRILGEVALRRGEPQRALDLLRQGSALAEVAGDYGVRLGVMTSLGRAEAQFGDLEIAANALEVALRMARKGGLRLEEVKALVGLGWMRLRQGDLAEANAVASIAKDQAELIGYQWGTWLATELAETLGSTGQEQLSRN